VAVARGLVHFSVATDTAGSARIPAACNGVIGLSLANSGRLLADAVQLAPSLDQLGLITRDAQMLQRVLEALGLPIRLHPPEELLIPADLLRKYCSTETISRFNNTVSRLRAEGWRITEASSQPFTAFDELQDAHGSLALAEISRSLQGFIGQEREQIDPGLLERLRPYLQWSADELAGLRSRVSALAASLRDCVWLLPTLPGAVPLASATATSPPLGVLTKYANLMAMNSISIPAHQADSIMLQSACLPALLGFAFRAGSDRKP
jgi:Asp-tRNA(Asn)/Glu-tRNA(Gln) amidotransferase A subunit family amidase